MRRKAQTRPTDASSEPDRGSPEARQRHPWRSELEDYARAFGSAFLFGIPLLYTMEMWALGSRLERTHLLLLLGLTFAANIVLAHFGGIHQGHGLLRSLEEALDAMAIGTLAAACVLFVLNRVRWGDPLNLIVGQIAVQAVPLSLGASIAQALFAKRGAASDEGPPDRAASNAWKITLNDLGATLVGGLFIGFSIAPTEEIQVLATELTLGHRLGLLVFSWLVTYLIVFETAYGDEAVKTNNEILFQQPLTETTLAYVVSLAVATLVLVLMNQIRTGDPPGHMIDLILVLGLPVTIGGAAGRLVL